MKKILFVGSSGGHLLQLVRIREVFEEHEQVWVCFNKPDAQYFLKNHKVYWCSYPTTRHLLNLIKNTWQAFYILFKERPNVIVSSGAGIAIPYFYLGKLIGCQTIFIEAFNRINIPSLTGKSVYPVTDVFCVQWSAMLKSYPKAYYIGRLP